MQIAIVGAGKVGTALAKGWFHTGHDIVFGVIDPADSRHETAAASAGPGVQIASVGKAVEGADCVVLAVPWQAVETAIEACGDLSGRTLIDVTNPLRMGADGVELALGFDRSGAEMVQMLAKDAFVFKAMNQVGYQVMADAQGYPARPAMFIAGDAQEQKRTVLGLVADLGFEPIDAGPLKLARLLEPYAMLWIHQVLNRGHPPDSAFAFMHRTGGH